ncbi:MAG TPA: hypothetical protein VNS34_00660 [Rhizobiaceae bacterium]|nr:hypothetical protein [Rhizobiaceae bacterium]
MKIAARALLRSLVFVMAMPLAGGSALAQEAAPALHLELNAVQPSDKGCRLTFVVNNRLGADLERVAFELALFNEAGAVDRLTVLAFKEMPAGKTKVSRFDIAGADCAKLSRVLINEATECVGTGIEPASCMRRLEATTKTGIAFGL